MDMGTPKIMSQVSGATRPSPVARSDGAEGRGRRFRPFGLMREPHRLANAMPMTIAQGVSASRAREG